MMSNEFKSTTVGLQQRMVVFTENVLHTHTHTPKTKNLSLFLAKKYIILTILIFLSLGNTSYGQSFPGDTICGVTPHTPEEHEAAIIEMTNFRSWHEERSETAYSLITIPVYWTVFRHDDESMGQLDTPFTQTDADELLTRLNTLLYPSFLELVQCGDINYVDNDNLRLGTYDESYASYISTALNIWIGRDAGSAGFTASFSNGETTFPFETYRKNYLSIIGTRVLSTGTFEHEFGHRFGLSHTFKNETIYPNFIDETGTVISNPVIYNNPFDLLPNYIPFLDDLGRPYNDIPYYKHIPFLPPNQAYIRYNDADYPQDSNELPNEDFFSIGYDIAAYGEGATHPRKYERELVIRTVDSDKQFTQPNWDRVSDMIEDTPLTPFASLISFPSSTDPDCEDYNTYEDCSKGFSYAIIPQSGGRCEYLGDYIDYNGDPIPEEDWDIIANNVMSYNCRNDFTPMQYERMAQATVLQVQAFRFEPSLCVNLSDFVEFEDTDKPIKNVNIQVVHPNPEANEGRHSYAMTGNEGKFQGILYDDVSKSKVAKMGEEGTYTPPDCSGMSSIEAALCRLEGSFDYTQNDWKKDITLPDVLLMRRYILGQENLQEPPLPNYPPFNGYKKLAADVNNDGEINSADMVLETKMILGLINEFPDIKEGPWRFIPEYIPYEQNTTFHNNPFGLTLNTIELVEPIDDDAYLQTSVVTYDKEAPYVRHDWMMETLDGNNDESGFDGIKMGNVSGGYEIELIDCPEVEVPLYMPLVSKGVGEIVEIEIKSHDFSDVIGFQLSFDIDKDYLEFIDVDILGLPELSKEDNFGLNRLDENEMSVVWFDENLSPRSFTNGTALFSVKLNVKENITNLQDFFNLNETRVKAQFITSEGCMKAVQLEAEIKNITSNEWIHGLVSANGNNELEVVANTKEQKKEIIQRLGKINCFPNPTEGNVEVVFKSKLPDFGKILVYNALGEKVFSRMVNLIEGLNQISISGVNLPEGLLIITVESKEGRFSQRVMKVK